MAEAKRSYHRPREVSEAELSLINASPGLAAIYRCGWAAADRDAELCENPYAARTTAAVAWSAGWRDQRSGR